MAIHSQLPRYRCKNYAAGEFLSDGIRWSGRMILPLLPGLHSMHRMTRRMRHGRVLIQIVERTIWVSKNLMT